MPLPTGSPAPVFSLVTFKDGKPETVNLADHRGKDNVVLLFVPAAFSGPCTDELCDVSNGVTPIPDSAVVYGISVDSPFAQSAWKDESGISFPLLSDLDKKTIRDYQIELEDFFGAGTVSKRAVVVVDKSGVIQHFQVTPSPGELPDMQAVAKAVEGLG